VLFVLAAWRAGSLLAGNAGGRWAAGVAAGVMCSPGVAADQADGELFGAAFVMVSIALALSAWHASSPTSSRCWTAAAGVVAGAAPLVKQNLLEGLLLLAGLIVFGYWGRDEAARRRAAGMAPMALAGALLPAVAVALWLAGVAAEPAGAWRDLVGFRRDALEVIWSTSPSTSLTLLAQLLMLGVLTGVVLVAIAWFCCARRHLPDRAPERRTITALLLFGFAAITAGGSYWAPYLLQLAPATVLAAGAIASAVWMRSAVGVVVFAAAVTTIEGVVVHAAVPSTWYSQRIGEWLSDAKAPGDTGFVAYGHAGVLESADLPSPYPHLWSVPMRTLDPEQARLRDTLGGPGAPTWIVQVNGLNAWGIDDGARLKTLIRDRYEAVAEICGSRVWLRQDATRELPPVPHC
jgi:hypothetical protein